MFAFDNGESNHYEGLRLTHFYPESGLMWIITRLPLVLWRLGLGPILGKFLILITTRGRKSENPHRVITEYYCLGEKFYVPCAFGERSDWYQNILNDPQVTIQTSAGTRSAMAARVTEEEEFIEVYNLMHKKNELMLLWYLKSLGIEDNLEDILNKRDRIFLFRFEPIKDAQLPAQEVDLAWIYSTILLGLLVLRGIYNFLFERGRKS